MNGIPLRGERMRERVAESITLQARDGDADAARWEGEGEVGGVGAV